MNRAKQLFDSGSLRVAIQGIVHMAQEAVVVDAERAGRRGDPCVMVIFGASGDLTRRKLIPSLYNLAKYNLLSREFAVIGVARNAMSAR